eukprot:CAMPEP_0178669944 /NCGR_PEP_ID=MMETSP0698-20121128/32396_1 /TAXON_ID=265572 /ORGANISM="Extubocellulus spinifer, Strain CCMP396" /LENGTH=96 /DNA_ID=CAMNT_0020313637 /DNA_START=272 /DNA_END=562 /DNA_ORIENTATION=-
MWCINIPSWAGYVLQSRYVGLVTLISTSPVRARTKPREKQVLVPIDTTEPTSSISSGVGTDSLSVYASSLSSSVARILGSSGPKVDILSGADRDEE